MRKDCQRGWLYRLYFERIHLLFLFVLYACSDKYPGACGLIYTKYLIHLGGCIRKVRIRDIISQKRLAVYPPK